MMMIMILIVVILNLLIGMPLFNCLRLFMLLAAVPLTTSAAVELTERLVNHLVLRVHAL